MNAEQVVEKILSQANAEAQAILAEAKAKADAQQKQTDAELAEFEKQTQTMAQAAAEDKLRRMLAGARMAYARQVLAVKGEILNQVFETALQRINQLPDDPYQTLMKKLMKQAIETGDEEVIIGKDEKRIHDEFIKKVNQDLGPGFKGNLRMGQKRADISGGFLLSRGRVQINVSTEVLIHQLRESMEMELAGELFPAASKQG